MKVALQRVKDSWPMVLLGIVLPVVALIGLLTRESVRQFVADRYDDKWVIPAVMAIALVVTVLAYWRRGRLSVRVVTTAEALAKELKKTVETAEKELYCVGSRSRDDNYLDAIVDRLRAGADVQHKRILYGPPAHATMKKHLVTLDGLRQAHPKRIHIHMLNLVQWTDPEQSFCASEKRAVIVTPSLGRLGRYESAIVLTNRAQVDAVVKYAAQLLDESTELAKTDAITALETTRTASVPATAPE